MTNLADHQPSWKSLPPIPTRLTDGDVPPPGARPFKMDAVETAKTPTLQDAPSEGGTRSGKSAVPFGALLVGGDLVVLNGILVQTVVPYLTMDIAGLGDALDNTAGSKVWLEVEIDSQMKPTEAKITSGTEWPSYAEYSESPGYVQTKATCRIGMVVAGELPAGTPGFGFTSRSKPVHFLQQISTNLCMTACAISGKAALLPLPFAG